jgi:spore germination protein YaaH
MRRKNILLLILVNVVLVGLPISGAHATTISKETVTSTKTVAKVSSSSKKKHKVKKVVSIKKVALASAIIAPVVPTVITSDSFETSGWIPYWRTATGTADVLPHIKTLTEINPFGFTVKRDGTVNDALKINDPSWLTLQAAAATSHTRYIPTVMWSDTNAIHNVLSDPTLRASHEQSIVQAVAANGLDGIDIDYEGKLAEDQQNFSLFLKELSERFAKNKTKTWLMCTIEAREPLSARYSGTPPEGIAYANDLKAINTYCDRVRLMTYDQENADIQLNAAHSAELYTPIADPAWVTKVVNYMAQDIDKKKIILGVATYGYIYQAMPHADGSGYTYDLLEAFNPRYATELATSLGITPARSAAGELSFSYVPSTASAALPSNAVLSALAPSGTASANLAAVGAIQLAQTKHQQAPVQYLTWSDAQAIQDKVTLAKQLGLRGVALFKFDGGEDQNIWNVLK